jgi:hypothetical protein
MGLLRKRKRTTRRALRKAHTKALKAQAQAEKKFQEKAARKAAKDRKKGRSAAVVVAQAPAVADEQSRAAKKSSKKALEQVSTPQKVKNVLAIARVLSPVLAPLAYKAATTARTQLDAARARKIGVDVHRLGDFTGHGAALNARISGLETSLEELADHSSDTTAFRETTRARLADLATAVHAAERMPAARRKAAHRAVATELDEIDGQLLNRLGVR